MSRYHCNNCDTSFQHEERKGVRCPSCLRVNGIELLTDGKPRTKKPSGGQRRGLMMGGLLVALLCAIGGVALLVYRQRTDVPKPGQRAVLGSTLLKQTLQQRGVPADKAIDPFCSDSAAVRSLVGEAGSRDVKKRVETLTARLAKKLQSKQSKQSMTRVKLTDIGRGPVHTAKQLAKKLGKQKLSVLSYELAVLVAGALRSVGVPALLCEAHELVDTPMRSADANGALGRFGVAVFASEEALGGDPIAVLDPARAVGVPSWAGGKDSKMRSVAKSCKPLDDASAAAHLLSLRAQAAIRRAPKKEAAAAYELSGLALKGGGSTPTLLVGRAMVLAASGGTKDALDALLRAKQQRADAPRLTAAARMQLAQGDPVIGVRLLKQAIKKDPNYWPARSMLATVSWLRGKKDEGNKHLAVALEVAPEEPAVLGGQADRLAFEGKHDEAIAVLRKAVAADPLEPQQLLLKLYLALLRQGKTEESKPIRKRLLEVSSDKQQMKRALEAMDQQAGQAAGASSPPSPSADEPPAMPKLPKLKLPDVKLGK